MVVVVEAGWRREVSDLARAAAGGLLFGVPLLYTMELWWTGERSTAWEMLAVLAVTFAGVVLLQRTSGFRRTTDIRWRDALIDAADVVALSLLVVTGVLVLLREVTLDTPLQVALGKIVHQALAFAIGASVAHHYLTESRDGDGDESGDGADAGIDPTVADLGASAIGAVFIALNIAPTDEVPMLDAALSAGWVIAVLVASLVISYVIVFVAGFSGEQQRHGQTGVLQHPISETVVSYVIALAASVAMLALFHRIEGPWTLTLTRAVVLALPAAVGGAAGRRAV